MKKPRRVKVSKSSGELVVPANFDRNLHCWWEYPGLVLLDGRFYTVMFWVSDQVSCHFNTMTFATEDRNCRGAYRYYDSQVSDLPLGAELDRDLRQLWESFLKANPDIANHWVRYE